MNRERDLLGRNGYETDLGFDPLAQLLESANRNGRARWLDLCCGTGKALIDAGRVLEADGRQNGIEITGVDLVGMFWPGEVPPNVDLIEASLTSWQPAKPGFDLITCVHGLHYIGDKLDLISRAVSWLSPMGRFAANLDMNNIVVSGYTARLATRLLREAGLKYHTRKRLLTRESVLNTRIPLSYLGADDRAGPNYTGQPAVNSHYERNT